MVGGERPGVCAAVDRLQGRGLELQVVPLEEELPQERDDPAPGPERLAALLVHDQVEVTLPVAGLDVLEPVEFLGEGADRFCEEFEPVDPDGDLPHLCPEDVADNADDVPGVDVLPEEVELLFSKVVLPEVKLYSAAGVPHVGEHCLAVLADDVDPARGADFFSALLVSDLGEPFLDLLDGILAFEGIGVYRHPALQQILYLIDLCRIKTEMIHIAHSVNSSICLMARLSAPNRSSPLFRGYRAAFSLVNPIYTSPPMLLTFEEDEAGRCERAEETPPLCGRRGCTGGTPKVIPKRSLSLHSALIGTLTSEASTI